MDSREHQPRPSGVPQAIAAYTVWGFIPLYLLLVRAVPAFEFVAWRIIFTLPICLVIIAFRKQGPDVMAALRSPHTFKLLALSSALIFGNWLIYIWAIQQGHVYGASLGYYINPLVNVLLGTLLLGEKLTRRQWWAVSFAAGGVTLLLGGAFTTLWISMSLAISFGTYGLIRKQVPVGSVPGLTIESLILCVPSAALTLWYAWQPAGSSFGHELALSFYIALGGVVTAVPLLLFAIAARRMDYSTLGFFQFIAPTIVFILGLTVFNQPLLPAQIGAFILIWIAMAIFVADLWQRRMA